LSYTQWWITAVPNEEIIVKSAGFQTVLIALLVAAIGCENESANVATPRNVLTLSADKGKFYYTDIDPIYLNDEFLDSLEYEEFSGILDPNMGAILIGEMETWPGGGDFFINIKPEALPDDYYPIEFSMRIPTYRSYQNHPRLPLLIRLEPSHINFLVPLGVMGTYMPWTGVTVDDLFEYFCLTPEYETFGAPEVFEVDRKVMFRFSAPHFSDWGVGGGGQDREPRNPK
jgi:hypothetical protein